MTDRQDLQDAFGSLAQRIVDMDLGARGVLMVETVVLAKAQVLEVYDGPELPVRNYNAREQWLAAQLREARCTARENRLAVQLQEARRKLEKLRLSRGDPGDPSA